MREKNRQKKLNNINKLQTGLKTLKTKKWQKKRETRRKR